jgi:hypothetical protein
MKGVVRLLSAPIVTQALFSASVRDFPRPPAGCRVLRHSRKNAPGKRSALFTGKSHPGIKIYRINGAWRSRDLFTP